MAVDRKTKTFCPYEGAARRRYYTLEDIQDRRYCRGVAAEMWQKLADEYVKKEGGEFGSCIGGDCIETYVLRPRCRRPRLECIVRSPAYQSGTVKGSTVDPVLKFLREEYNIECWQAHGWMD